ncbi:MAG: type II secretion system protein J [Acidimicrobiales bacterium]
MSHLANWRLRDRGDEGASLVELMVALAITSILTTVSLLVFSTYTRVDEDNKASYSELNQLIPVGTSFQRLLRTAVSPASAGTPTVSPPIPPFGHYQAYQLSTKWKITTTSLTFYSNNGTRYGPVRVTAYLTSHYVTFRVTVTKPLPGSCPSVHTQSPTGTCTWTGNKPTTLFTVSDIYNHKLTTPNTPSKPKAIFKYYLNAPYDKTTPTTPANPATFATCTKPIQKATPNTPNRTITETRCPAANINSVKVDLEVKSGTTSVGKLESQTVTYQLSSTSQEFSPEVG